MDSKLLNKYKKLLFKRNWSFINFNIILKFNKFIKYTNIYKYNFKYIYYWNISKILK